MRISPVHVGLRIKINPRFPAGTTQTHCGMWMWDSRLNAMNIKTISNCILHSNRLLALKAGLMEVSGCQKNGTMYFFSFSFSIAKFQIRLQLRMLGHRPIFLFHFYTPFQKRRVLCYGGWRPSIHPSTRNLFRFRLTPPTVYIQSS